MICTEFDPITASCAPSCCVCGRNGECHRTGEKSTNELRANTEEMQNEAQPKLRKTEKNEKRSTYHERTADARR